MADVQQKEKDKMKDKIFSISGLKLIRIRKVDNSIDEQEFEKLLYWGNVFEVEWLKYISSRYFMHANKDIKRIKMIEDRITLNKI